MNFDFFKTKTDVIEEQRKEVKKFKEEEFKNLQIACKEVFKGNEGFLILKFLKNTCLWDSQNTNIDDGILKYQKGRRDVWLILRQLLPKDILAQVEIYK